MKNFLTYLIFITWSSAHTQQVDFDNLSKKYALKHLSTLLEYVRIPCDANFPQDIEKNIEWVEKEFVKRGFVSETINTPTLPVLLLEKKSVVTGAKTILFYYHSDGQPVIPSQWQQPDPFEPVLKKKNQDGKWEIISLDNLKNGYDPEWRLFARAVSDDKGPGVMLLAALDAINEVKIKTNYNIKILVDFEEEKGSVSLPGLIEKNRSKLKTDLLLILDGPAHNTNLPTLSFGARGITTLTLTTYGPSRPLHSGHYGNYAPNPAMRMARLLTAMKDEDGKVLIPGYYDGVFLSPKMAEEIAQVPDDIQLINKNIGVKNPEKVGRNYQESLVYPSLNIRGLKSADVGSLAATIVPEKCVAEIDIRTVRGTYPDTLADKVKKFILTQGYHVIEHEPSIEERLKFDKILTFKKREGYASFSTDMTGPEGAWLYNAIYKSTGKKPLKIPTMGGSVPISPFVSMLGVTAVAVPTVNNDNNQHSANENLRLANFEEGIRVFIGILSENF